MYCYITTLPVAFYWARSDDTYIRNITKQWIFAVLDVQLRRLNRFLENKF